MGWLKWILIVLVLLAAAGGIAYYMFGSQASGPAGGGK